jgi:hypothetical protein
MILPPRVDVSGSKWAPRSLERKRFVAMPRIIVSPSTKRAP